jgi:penicillin amidase
MFYNARRAFGQHAGGRKDAFPLNLSRWFLRLLLGRRLPRTSGDLIVPALVADVRIDRDAWGIPHITAANDLDAFFAVGFCHGQDRSFQLEILLRVSRGTLSEMVGARAVPIDRLSRRIGFHRSSKQQWPVLDADVREMLEAYSRGVNAGRSLGSPRQAHEFTLLRAAPSEWTALDCLGCVKLTSFTLPTNWDVELARLRILTDDGPEALAALDPAYPQWLPTTSPPLHAAGPMLNRLADDLAAFTAAVKIGGGSNNWTVAGSRTATGRPLVANDPHLDPRLPCHWYLAHVHTPEWQTAGATFLGGPNVVCGHNGHGAWGLTAGVVDNTDLFIEQIGPDGCSVRQGDGFVPCEVCDEVINVRKGAAVTERVLLTPRGPIISPAFDGIAEALSLRAVWLDPQPVRGLLDLHRARSFEEVRKALSVWPATSQNLVYGDVTGKIGWQLFGEAPNRRSGWGTLPLPGWIDGNGWEEERVPFPHMPHAVDPPVGFISTANNKPLVGDDGPFLGVDWIDGYRQAAIGRALAARSDWDVAKTMALQMDQRSLPWEEMRELVLALPANNPEAARGLDMLRKWDGFLAVESPAAAVYELFLNEMVRRVALAKAPKSWSWVLGRVSTLLMDHNFFAFRRTGHLIRLMREQPAGWFARSWPEEMADALAAAVRSLRTVLGEDEGKWAWGRMRSLTLRHPLGRASRWLAKVFNLGPIPCGGDSDTINQASVFPPQPLSDCHSIASMRMVVDVGAWDNSRWSLPGGQSGNPLSPHYDDLFILWQRGDGVPIAWSPEAVRQTTRATLRLMAKKT